MMQNWLIIIYLRKSHINICPTFQQYDLTLAGPGMGVWDKDLSYLPEREIWAQRRRHLAYDHNPQLEVNADVRGVRLGGNWARLTAN